MEKCMSLIIEKTKNDDKDIEAYVESVLQHGQHDFAESSDVYDAIGPILESSTTCDSGLVEEICEEVFNILSGLSINDKHFVRKLDAPIYIAQIKKQDDKTGKKNAESIWMAKQDKKSLVDSKKLEKAEAKIKQKQEKKSNTSQARTESSSSPVQMEASASQAVNRKDIRNEMQGKNKTKDIHIENFDISFGNKVLFEEANLHIAHGRRYGLVGRNGLGKTTLLKMISTRGLAIPGHIDVLHVEQEVEGNDTIALESVLECDTVRANLLKEEKLLQSKMEKDQSQSSLLSEIYTKLADIEADKAPSRAATVLNGLGFTTAMQKMPTKNFSGGWRMRLALARALFAKPDLLLLDEPTNMLDIKAILWLENYLQEWPTTLFVTSHDRNFLESICTDILHLQSRKLDSYRGSFEQFLATKDETLKNRQKEYEAQKQYRDHVQVFIDRFRYNANRASQVQSKLKLLEKLPKLIPIEKEQPCVVKFPDSAANLSGTALQLDEVYFSYAADKLVFNGAEISAGFDSRICIVGENGSGKTTLLKLLCGTLEPVKGVRHAHRNLRIGYFTQHHVDQLDLNVSSLELLENRFPGRSQEEYRHQLGSFGISGDLALQSVGSLSGGQKSRLAFSILCVPRPNFLILDEPTNHLDMETIEALGVAINEFAGGVLLVSHDERLICKVCRELWLCRDKKVSSIEGGYDSYRSLLEDELKRLNSN
ncbi:ATP-binding cassette sub-family F member 3-like [Clavelina lepadiformis]|uniref:ATP-binding cassette sub-family F member 3-like n=1 Tax=Clavelina lepadiformis TaxID=159417 RepID=UPI004043308D